jgi:predicted RNA-binding protein YlqC (UPF0109 family)
MIKNFKKKFALMFIFLGLIYFTLGIMYNAFFIDRINAREQYIIAIADSIVENEDAIEVRENILKKIFKRSFIRYFQSDNSTEEIINKYKKNLLDNGYNISINKQSVKGEKNGIIITIEKTNQGFCLLIEYNDIFNKLNL